jgi:hypothetical protein
LDGIQSYRTQRPQHCESICMTEMCAAPTTTNCCCACHAFSRLLPIPLCHLKQVATNAQLTRIGYSVNLLIGVIGEICTPSRRHPGQPICRRFHMREPNDMANGALLCCVMLRCAVLCRMVCGVLFSNYVVLCYLLGPELWLAMLVNQNLTDSVLETSSVIPSICMCSAPPMTLTEMVWCKCSCSQRMCTRFLVYHTL